MHLYMQTGGSCRKGKMQTESTPWLQAYCMQLIVNPRWKAPPDPALFVFVRLEPKEIQQTQQTYCSSAFGVSEQDLRENKLNNLQCHWSMSLGFFCCFFKVCFSLTVTKAFVSSAQQWEARLQSATLKGNEKFNCLFKVKSAVGFLRTLVGKV